MSPAGRRKVPMVCIVAPVVFSGEIHSQGHPHIKDWAVAHNASGNAVPKDNAVCLSGVQLAEPGLVADASVQCVPRLSIRTLDSLCTRWT